MVPEDIAAFSRSLCRTEKIMTSEIKWLGIFFGIVSALVIPQNARAQDLKVVNAWEYDPGVPPAAGGATTPDIFSPDKLEVSPGDRVTFQANFEDIDKRRPIGEQAWSLVVNPGGP